MIQLTSNTIILDESDLRAIMAARGMDVRDAELSVALHTNHEQHSAPADEARIVVQVCHDYDAVSLPILRLCNRRYAA